MIMTPLARTARLTRVRPQMASLAPLPAAAVHVPKRDIRPGSVQFHTRLEGLVLLALKTLEYRRDAETIQFLNGCARVPLSLSARVPLKYVGPVLQQECCKPVVGWISR